MRRLSLQFDYLIDDKKITPQESINFQEAFLEVEKQLQEKKTINFKDFKFLCDLPETYFNDSDYAIDPTLSDAYTELLARNPNLKPLVDTFNGMTEDEQTELDAIHQEMVSHFFEQGGGLMLAGAVCVPLAAGAIIFLPGWFKLVGLVPAVAVGPLLYWGFQQQDTLIAETSDRIMQQMNVTDAGIRFEMVE